VEGIGQDGETEALTAGERQGIGGRREIEAKVVPELRGERQAPGVSHRSFAISAHARPITKPSHPLTTEITA
jgi:hypothetical protein